MVLGESQRPRPMEGMFVRPFTGAGLGDMGFWPPPEVLGKSAVVSGESRVVRSSSETIMWR